MGAVCLLAAVEFLVPLFLWGCLAALVPVVLHLLQRQRAPRVTFSTLRYLRRSVDATARRRRLRDLLLLMVRMALLAVLAVALAQPLLTASSAPFGRGSEAVALILDNSASMGWTDAGETRFERARRAAGLILSALDDGTEIALLPTAGPLAGEQLEYRRRENIERLLETVEVRPASAYLPASIEAARSLLSTAKAKQRTIVVITDLQSSGWSPRAVTEGAGKSSAASPGKADSEQPDLVVVDVHRGKPPNVAIQSVEVRSPGPWIGASRHIVAQVRNASGRARPVQLEMLLDGQFVARSQPLQLETGQTREFTFQHVSREPETAEGQLVLVGDDASSLDNSRYFVLAAQPPVQVALVTDRSSGSTSSFKTSGYYVERALRPVDETTYAIELSQLAPDQLADEPLSGFRAVVCADVFELSAPAFAALQRYVEGGGTLVWICGPRSDPRLLSEPDRHGGLFPGHYERIENTPEALRRWSDLDADNPTVAPLAETPSLYQSVAVERYLRIRLPAETAAQTVIRLDNGDPALLLTRRGRGRLWLLTTGASPEWSNLPLRPIFVPLMHRLVLTAPASQGSVSEVVPGTPAVLRFPEETGPVTVEIRAPGIDEPTRLRSVLQDGIQTIRFEDTHRPGVYRWRTVSGQHPRKDAFCVNVDSLEIDPDTISDEQLQKRLGSPIRILHSDDELQRWLARAAQGGTPLRAWFLVVAILVGLAEPFLANRMRAVPAAPASSTTDRVAALKRARELHQLGDVRRLAGGTTS